MNIHDFTSFSTKIIIQIIKMQEILSLGLPRPPLPRVGGMENRPPSAEAGFSRNARHLTAKQLAELCHIDDTFLRQIEGGTKLPSLPVFTDVSAGSGAE